MKHYLITYYAQASDGRIYQGNIRYKCLNNSKFTFELLDQIIKDHCEYLLQKHYCYINPESFIITNIFKMDSNDDEI